MTNQFFQEFLQQMKEKLSHFPGFGEKSPTLKPRLLLPEESGDSETIKKINEEELENKEVELQKAQIKWIKENVNFYPLKQTVVYHQGSAYDILMACRKYKIDYQESPRLFMVAVRWRIQYDDAAEMIQAVDMAQS